MDVVLYKRAEVETTGTKLHITTRYTASQMHQNMRGGVALCRAGKAFQGVWMHTIETVSAADALTRTDVCKVCQKRLARQIAAGKVEAPAAEVKEASQSKGTISYYTIANGYTHIGYATNEFVAPDGERFVASSAFKIAKMMRRAGWNIENMPAKAR